MRHIFSSSNSPSSGLEVKINKILNNINNKSNFILNSADVFRDKIKDLKIPRGFEIVTGDIKKMFESISIDKTLEFTAKILKLEENKNCLEGIEPDYVIKGIKTIIENSGFLANSGEPVKLKNGLLTGNRLSVSLANLRLTEVENEFVKNNENILFYVRYVDDILMVVRSSELENLRKNLIHLNSKQNFRQ